MWCDYHARVTCVQVDGMAWHPVELKAGQTLFFHSKTPHKSGANHSANNRRALYPTYKWAACGVVDVVTAGSALREGDLRDAYYKEKLAQFAAKKHEGGTVQVGQVHFQSCTHRGRCR